MLAARTRTSDQSAGRVPRAALSSRWERLLQFAERRLPALTRYRQAEPLPIALHRRRVYIIPTGFGLFFGFVLIAMLLGGLNFNNNSALLLTFLVAGAVMISLPRTVGNLNTLTLTAVHAGAVHAGDRVVLGVQLVPRDGIAHPGCRLAAGDQACDVDIAADGTVAEIALPTVRRGWQATGRLTLSTEYPLGLFRAWSVLHPQQQILVYARPEASPPPLPRGSTRDAGRETRPHGEDWHGLRDYRPGDATRLVAWKASARHDRLLVKEFAEPAAEDVVLDWHAMPGVEREQRISRLTRWVLEASAQRLSFRLVLPDSGIGPGRDPHHTERCLRELALLP